MNDNATVFSVLPYYLSYVAIHNSTIYCSCNFGTNVIYAISSDGQSQSVFASGLNGPLGLAFDTGGHLYCANYDANTVVKFSLDGTSSSVFCNTNLVGPTGLAFDAGGYLYCSCQNGTIVKIATDGTSTVVKTFDDSPVLKQIAFRGDNLYGVGVNQVFQMTPSGDVTYIISGILGATGLAFDNSGNMFVSAKNLGYLYWVSSDFTQSTICATSLCSPLGLCISNNLVYTANSQVKQIVTTPVNITTAITVSSSFEVGVSTQTSLNAVTNSSVPIVYQSSDTSVATVDSNGVVTALQIGTTTISMSQEAMYLFSSATASSAVSVNASTVIVLPSSLESIEGAYPFNLTATSNSPAPFLYSSLNVEVATIDETGEITIVGAGNATLVVSQNATTGYTSGSASTPLYVAPATVTTIDVQSEFDVNVGTPSFNLNATSNSSATISYVSSDTEVATVDSTGQIVIYGAGLGIVTLRQPMIPGYTSAAATVTIVVDSQVITVLTVDSDITVTNGVIPFNLNASSNSPAPITYSSSDSSVATIDNSGVVFVQASSVTPITLFLEQAGFEEYTAASATCALTVLASTIDNPTVVASENELAYALNISSSTTVQCSEPIHLDVNYSMIANSAKTLLNADNNQYSLVKDSS